MIFADHKLSVTDNGCTVHLFADDAANDCVLTVRVFCEPAPGYGHEVVVELEDIEGPSDGAAWFAANRETLADEWIVRKAGMSWTN